MKVNDIKTTILSSLQNESYFNYDESGESLYDKAFNLLLSEFKNDNVEILVIAFISIAKTAKLKDVSWWIRFSNLFDVLYGMGRTEKVKLLDTFERYPPDSLEAQCYLLRKLAYLNCPIRWDDILSSQKFDKFSKLHPLLLADAMIWAGKDHEVIKVLSFAVKSKNVEHDDFLEMLERWSERISHQKLKAIREEVLRASDCVGNVFPINCHKGISSNISSFNEILKNSPSSYRNVVNES